MNRFESQLPLTEPAFSALVRNIPLQDSPPLPPDWLRVEMLERYQILRQVRVDAGSTVLEVGSGPHAIATVPLAFVVGSAGSVLAAEPSRWSRFRAIVAASGMTNRIHPVRCDARHLPFESSSVDLSACLHGIRSMGDPENLVAIVREMLRVTPRAILAETLPVAQNDAQRAHQAMYDLRHEVFEMAFGRQDDLPYPSMDTLATLVERAGGTVEVSRTLEMDLPHALAHFPRALIEEVPDAVAGESLLRRWDEADALAQRFGTDHPPVAIVIAARA